MTAGGWEVPPRQGRREPSETARPAVILVGTPIGNLGDLSPRAVEALTAADVIAAEDTRRTRPLLTAMGIPAGTDIRARSANTSTAWKSAVPPSP